MPDETLQQAGADLAHQQSNQDRQAAWIKDGTPTSPPVTTETPAAPAAPAAPETVQVRHRDGTLGTKLPADALPEGVRPAFTPKPEGGAAPTSATPTPGQAASATASPAAPAPGASATEIADFIEAQLENGEPFKLPKGLRLPMKRNGQVEYDPLDRVMTERMLERDYRHKTADAARARRELEQQQTALRAAEAKLQAREQWLGEREAQMVEAQKDPEKWESYLEMQRRYREDPVFRKLMDDALRVRETDAELGVFRERDHAAVVADATAMAADWIAEIGQDPDFAGVDPERVRAVYAHALTTGQAQLSPDAVRGIYEQEAAYLSRSQSPLQRKLAELTAQVAELTAAKGAERHNAVTTHALTRAATPPVVTGAGRPPAGAPPAPPKRFGINELAERNQQWASER